MAATITSVPALNIFQDENLVAGLPPGPSFTIQSGISNEDDGTFIEQGITLGWVIDPRATWLGYDCSIDIILDAGMVLHRPLPQSPYPADSLASANVSPVDRDLESNTEGVETESSGNWTDVVQRMANSDYRFILKGWGVRLGYKVPIPGLVTVAGVPAIPDSYQRAYNKIIGNYSGIPLWLAQWELWYMVALPPRSAQVPPPNVNMHIKGDSKVPDSMQMPYSQPDSNAVRQIPPQPGLIQK